MMAENLNISALRIDCKPLKYLEENLRISLNKIKGNDLCGCSNLDASVPLPDFWKRLGSSVEALSKESTKLSLVFSKPPFPSEKEIQSLVDGVEMVIISLLSSFSMFSAQQGSTLHKAVQTFVHDILNAFLDFVCAIKDENKEESLKCVGVVWECCELLNTLPKDPKEAVLRQMKSSCELINDAVTEAEEFCNECDENESDDLPNDVKTALKRIRYSSVGLIKVAKAVLKKSIKSVSKNSKIDEVTKIKELDTIAQMIQHISPNVDDLVCCLYSTPTDDSSIKSQGITLGNLLTNLLHLCRNSHFCVDEDLAWLNFLTTALDHNLQNLNSPK